MHAATTLVPSANVVILAAMQAATRDALARGRGAFMHISFELRPSRLDGRGGVPVEESRELGSQKLPFW